MSQKVRVRFAPSPTGPLHIGGVRTALFNYLFAKKHGGDFLLRIEDTDRNRFVEGAEDYIIEALEWCGIPYDEGPGKDGGNGPYHQSERAEIYQAHIDKLIGSGRAYIAFDSPEDLESSRKEQEQQGKTFIYNWHNRESLKNSLSLKAEEVQSLKDSGVPYVIRFKAPSNRSIQLQDIVRGNINIDSSILDDKILFKSDGMPTYHLANVVDDHLMGITHVIRGEEWLPSLALHFLLYEAFEWEPPQFAHLPLLLKPVGKGKLSKRDGEKMGFPIFPLSWEESQGYREAGYYPEAVVNFLAMLGWNPGNDQEFFNLQELVESFSLDRVQKAGARFDPEKTKWYNNYYLQQKENSVLAAELRNAYNISLTDFDDAYLSRVAELLKERANFVSDIWSQGQYFFKAPAEYAEKAVKKHWKEDTSGLMADVADLLAKTNDFSSANLETEVKALITAKEIGFGKVMAPLRLVMVGDLKGPHLFDIMALIGKEESLGRLKKAIDTLP